VVEAEMFDTDVDDEVVPALLTSIKYHNAA
jgi:hypothetical protein